MADINWTNVTDPSNLIALPNTITNGYFWTAMLFMVFVIILIIMLYRNTKPEIAVMTSAFVGFGGGIFLSYAQLMNWVYVLFFVGLLVVTTLYTVYSATNDNLY